MLDVRILVQVVDAIRVEERCTALHTVHHVAALQQKFGEIGAVLAGNARDERRSLHESSQSAKCHTRAGLLQLWIQMCACDATRRTRRKRGQEAKRRTYKSLRPSGHIANAETHYQRSGCKCAALAAI
jgi:hypothetical protein